MDSSAGTSAGGGPEAADGAGNVEGTGSQVEALPEANGAAGALGRARGAGAVEDTIAQGVQGEDVSEAELSRTNRVGGAKANGGTRTGEGAARMGGRPSSLGCKVRSGMGALCRKGRRSQPGGRLSAERSRWKCVG